MNKPVRLSRRSGELLLRLLEQSRPVIAAAALEEFSFEARSTLIKVGALERHGASRTAFVAGDDGPTFRDLVWQADQNAYGYFDASDGNVVLAPEAQLLFRVALPWWLAWLAASLALTNSDQPTELVPTSAWDIGDLWITRQRIPILFVRRLHRDATLKALRQALQKRAGRGGGLILTSSQNPLRQDVADRPFVVVSIAEAMTNDSQVFAIDRTLLLSAAGDRASKPPQRSRRRPALERAQGAINELYPNDIPDQATEPNVILCRKVASWLKNNNMPEVSDPTILRAVHRRK